MTTETKEIQKPTQQISDAPEKEVSQLEKLFEELLEKKANLTMTRRGFEPGTMEEAWRFANALSESTDTKASRGIAWWFWIWLLGSAVPGWR